MKNKRSKTIANLIASGIVFNSMPVQALDNTLDLVKEEDNILKEIATTGKIIENEIIEGNSDSNIDEENKDGLLTESNSNSTKSTEEKVLEVSLVAGQNVPVLTGNPNGYETIKVITTGGKKLVKTDYDNLRLSGIPKVDLSEAQSDAIPPGAFAFATHLTEFKFPQGITSISENAGFMNGSFIGCENLTGALNIPETVTTIGPYAFRSCGKITGDLIIPDSVTTIGYAAFQNCSGFNGTLTIGNLVETIGSYTFENCSGFTGDLVIPDLVTEIGSYAFGNCSGFTGNLVIPDSVTSIGMYAFENCSGFNGTLTIGNLVETIGMYAFENCSGFTGNLLIPDSVTEIDYGAFNGCNNIEKIVIQISEDDKDTDYKASIIANFPLNRIWVEMPYGFDYSDTWMRGIAVVKAMPILKSLDGVFENNRGKGVSLEILTPYSESNISVLKDGEKYDLPAIENGKYIFREDGEYTLEITTDLGTTSNVTFNTSTPVHKPSLNYEDGFVDIVDNGAYVNNIVETVEDFTDENNLKFNFSNQDWIIENNTLRSNVIDPDEKTRNSFSVIGKSNSKLNINLKCFIDSERPSPQLERLDSRHYVHIFLNDELVHSQLERREYETIEFDLKEGENIVELVYEKGYYGHYGNDALVIDSIKVIDSENVIENSEVIEYRINGGEWLTYNDLFKLNHPVGEKVLLEARAKHDGFTSEIISKTIEVKDEVKDNEKPKINYELSPNNWTNENVLIKINASDNIGVQKIIKPDSSEVLSDNTTFEVTKNGEYEFTAVDTSGNIKTIVVKVDNIDKEGPTIEYEIDKGNDKYVIIDFNVTDDLSGLQSFISNDNLNKVEDFKYKVEKNGEYTFVGTDNVGNITKVTVKIDTIKDSQVTNPSKPNYPETRDNSIMSIATYSVLLVVSLVGLIKLSITNKKDKYIE